jgi:hypothetical protein
MKTVTITYTDGSIMLVTGVRAVDFRAGRDLYLCRNTGSMWLDHSQITSVEVRTNGGLK